MKVKHAILPGLILSILSLSFTTNWIASPRLLWENSANNAQTDESITTIDSVSNLSPAFPSSIQVWKDLIENVSSQYGLDPDLIASVMLQESGGDANAYSACGAVGLLQVMPHDGLAAEFMCGDVPCFRSRPSMQELADPQFNLDYGSRMLSGLFGKYGDWREALRAYGPMGVGYGYADIVLSIYENYD